GVGVAGPCTGGDGGLLTAGDRGQEEHVAVGPDRLEESVLVDLAIDGHGDAILEVARERRVQLGQLLEELFDGRRRELELGDAARDLREITDQDYPRHERGGPEMAPTPPTLVTPRETRGAPRRATLQAFTPRSLSAFRTFGGDIGSSVKRMPVAFSIALAMAPSGGTMGVSPTPRTPYGWRGFATSTRIASIIGTSDATGIR